MEYNSLEASRYQAHSLAQGPNAHSGQAILFGLILVSILSASFVLYYSSAREVQDKTELVNAADAAVFSGGVMVARELNFMAYTNRAIIANHVISGHIVGYDSWADGVGDIWDPVAREHKDSLGLTVKNAIASTAGETFDFSLDEDRVEAWMNMPGAVSKAAAGLHIATQQELIDHQVAAQTISAQLLQNTSGGEYFAVVAMREIANSYGGNVGTSYYDQQGIQINDPALVATLLGDPTLDPVVRAKLQALGTQSSQFNNRLVRHDPINSQADFDELRQFVDASIQSLPSAGWFSNRSVGSFLGRSRTGTTALQRVPGQAVNWEGTDTYFDTSGVQFAQGSSNARDLCQQVANSSAAFRAWDNNERPSISINNPRFFQARLRILNARTNVCNNYTGIPSYYKLEDSFAQGTDPSFTLNALFSRSVGRTENLGRSDVPTQVLTVFSQVNIAHSRPSCGGNCGPGGGFAALNAGARELPNLFNPFWEAQLARAN